MRVRVMVFANAYVNRDFWRHGEYTSDSPLVDYVLDYNDEVQRKRLATSCRDAFEAGQVVLTMPVD